MNNANAIEWITRGEVGVSSKTLWAVFMGTPLARGEGWAIPYDPDDFQRCYKLLQWVPEWRSRIREIGNFYPQWEPFAEAWDELSAMWEKCDDFQNRAACRVMYERMKELELEGLRRAEKAGWIKNLRLSEDGKRYTGYETVRIYKHQ